MQLMTPGVSPWLLTQSVNTKIHRVPTHSTGASPLSLTPSVNTKIHCVPSHSNLHGRRMSITLSTTIEHPNTKATFSIPLSKEPLPPSAANVLRAFGIAKLLNLSQSALSRHPHTHCYLAPSLQVQAGTTRKSSNITSPSARDSATFPTQLPSKQYRTSLLNSSPQSNLLPQNIISRHSLLLAPSVNVVDAIGQHR